MKISIITVCFNAVSTINDALASVASQKNVDVEHIVVDGGSKDGTKEVIQQHSNITKFISEPDAGIYDAMNKGIALATGHVIGILNADDFYMDENVLSEVVRVLFNDEIEACYGDLVYVKQFDTDKVVRYWQSKTYENGIFKTGWMPAHPTFFVKKSVYDDLLGFDLNYQLAADFELLFRFIEVNQVQTTYIPKVLVKMRLGGATNQSWKNIVNQNKEIIVALSKHYRNISITRFLLNKLVNRFLQYFDNPKTR